MKTTATLKKLQEIEVISEAQLNHLVESLGQDFCTENQMHPGQLISILMEHSVPFDEIWFLEHFEDEYSVVEFTAETVSGESDEVQNTFSLVEYLNRYLSFEYSNLISECYEYANQSHPSVTAFKFQLAAHKINKALITSQIETLKQELLDD